MEQEFKPASLPTRRLPPRGGKPQPFGKRGGGEGEDQSAWLITYADLITQLMCFFVLMAMVSNPNPEKLGEVARSLASGFIPDMVETPYAGMYKATESWIETQGIVADAAVSYSTRGVVIDLSGDLLFDRSSALPSTEAKARLAALAEDIKKLPLDHTRISVEGHTDDTPPASLYASSWELSAARAATVARILTESGVPPERIQTQAFGAFKPLLPNKDSDTHPIEANRKKNNRVIVRVEKTYD